MLVNKKGYFEGRRPNIRWWSATKQIGSPTGCRIQLTDRDPNPAAGVIVFEGTYHGLFPTGASETRIAKWIESCWVSSDESRAERFAVTLRFGSAKVNLGNIATGTVKSIIDNLYPILGGVPQAPDDWRIDSLLIAKGIEGLDGDGVQIIVRSLQ